MGITISQAPFEGICVNGWKIIARIVGAALDFVAASGNICIQGTVEIWTWISWSTDRRGSCAGSRTGYGGHWTGTIDGRHDCCHPQEKPLGWNTAASGAVIVYIAAEVAISA